MKAILGWLGRKGVLFAILLVAIGFYTLAWPSLSNQISNDAISADALSYDDVQTAIARERDAAQKRLETLASDAADMPGEKLRTGLADRRRALAEARLRRDATGGILSRYRPSLILERKRADIEIALIEREIAVLGAALDNRGPLEAAEARMEGFTQIPTQAAITATRRICTRRTADLAAFDQRWQLTQNLRNALLDERNLLDQRREQACDLAKQREQRRAEGQLRARQLRDARDVFARAGSIAADPLPDNFGSNITSNTLRDIAAKAFIALLLIIAMPLLIRLLFYFVLAPLAGRRPAIVLGGAEGSETVPPAPASTTSIALTLETGEELLVRQDYLQSTSQEGTKDTQWFLDWRRIFVSWASGMTFLTRIRGAGEVTSISAVKDPFAEVTVLTLPKESCAVIRPRAIAAIVQHIDQPMSISSHWRLFSLNAWLTFQLRYLVFHGPARVVIKGGRGVRVEQAQNGRIFGQDQMVGFSTDLAYSVTRTETFWPYFLGREPLLKDRVIAGRGIVIIEEAPFAGRNGQGPSGLEGALDAMFKAVGV